MNRDLYNAVNNYNKKDYFYSQSYWDRFDKTLLFTDSYWNDYTSCTKWLNSKTRQDIIDKYSDYFKVKTTYNILIDKIDSSRFFSLTQKQFNPDYYNEGEKNERNKIVPEMPFYKLDKNNLEIKNEYAFSKTVFGLPTVAVPIKDEVFLGSFHSDRLGIIEIK